MIFLFLKSYEIVRSKRSDLEERHGAFRKAC